MEKKLYDFKSALDLGQILKFSNKHKLDIKELDEEELKTPEKIDPQQRFYIIFTGQKDDEENNFHGKHWLLLDKNRIFDSYGKQDYNLPGWVKYYRNHPKQLQEFNTVVCGQYCLAAAHFLTNNSVKPQEFGPLFSDEFGFSSDKRENDELVKKWYDENK